MLYEDAGVNISKGDSLVDFIKNRLKSGKENIGPFSAIVELGKVSERYKDAVLLASTDGIGTKIKLAIDWDYLSGLGYDILGMCVNDIAVHGAEPIMFLDYFAMGNLDLEVARKVMDSVVKACEEYDCPLVGGETAELPGLLREKEFDIAGFVVGVQEKSKISSPSMVAPGDILFGLPSSGIHSNGFTLVRKIIEVAHITPYTLIGKWKALDLILAPTKIYWKIAHSLYDRFKLRGAAHITGGGIPGNLTRCLPRNIDATIDPQSWEIPEVFRFLQELGDVPNDEMWRVFNMGIGFIFIVGKQDAGEFEDFLAQLCEPYYIIGECKEGSGRVIIKS